MIPTRKEIQNGKKSSEVSQSLFPKQKLIGNMRMSNLLPAVPGERKNSGYGEKITRGERRRILPPAYAYWVGDEGVKSKFTIYQTLMPK